MRGTITSLGLAAALVAGALGADAAHMTQYSTNPVEHDDQGRSNEPDGATGGLYGAGVRDCTVDTDRDGRCTPLDLALWPEGEVVAQGCTDDTGRRVSGFCALNQGITPVGPAPIGYVGVPPLDCGLPAGERPLLMLDVRQALYPTAGVAGGHPIFELNRKLQDTGFFAVEQAILGGPGTDVLVGGTAMLAWYGYYHDKNCNGVIDQWGGEQADPRNEFTWIGDCLPFGGAQVVVPRDVCIPEPDTLFLGWEFPGNHHAGSGASCTVACVPTPSMADLPGRLVLCGLLSLDPSGSAAACDADEAGLNGDPLFGEQGSSRPDWYFYDYTGDPKLSTRTYVAAPNWPMWHYDNGLLTTTLVVGSVNPVVVEEGEVYDLSSSRLIDVDRLTTRSPILEGYLNGLVKPLARSTWLLVRAAL